MYNDALKAIRPLITSNPSSMLEFGMTEANQSARGYAVGIADMAEIGYPAGMKGTQTVVYTGTETHTHLSPINPTYQFDRPDLDRLINVVISREWNRQEYEPRRGILVMGGKGNGKTTYLRERLARQGIPAAELVWRPEMEAVDAIYTHEMVGGDVVLAPAAIQLAALGGYPVIIHEIDTARPGQLVALNEIIDTGVITIEKTGERIVAKRGFMVFATCNSSFVEDRSGQYAGTRTQSASVLDRFFAYVFEPTSEENEVLFLKGYYPMIEDEKAKQFARFAVMLRQAASSTGSGLVLRSGVKRLSMDLSRRNLIDWIDLTAQFAYLADRNISPFKYALGPVLTAKLPDDERATVEHLFDVAFGIAEDEVP